jgi:hypothetical protein
MGYKQIYKSEGFGGDFDFGIEINLAAPITESEHIRIATHKAVEIIEQAVTREFHANNSKSLERVGREKLELLNCFPEKPIYVEDIPNGYCNRACCEHLKWYRATTHVGHILIGWRKRVIEIDWSATKVRRVITEDSVTKSEIMVHAYGYEKAAEYLTELLK